MQLFSLFFNRMTHCYFIAVFFAGNYLFYETYSIILLAFQIVSSNKSKAYFAGEHSGKVSNLLMKCLSNTS